jgi:hypothetical protein
MLVIKWRVYSKNMPHLSICFENKLFNYVTALLAAVNLTKSWNDIHSRSLACMVHVGCEQLLCDPEGVTDVFTIQINQPTRCNNFSSLLLDGYVRLNMFRASSCPSSGAQQLQ